MPYSGFALLSVRMVAAIMGFARLIPTSGGDAAETVFFVMFFVLFLITLLCHLGRRKKI